MQLLPRLQPVRKVLAKVAGRPKEFPAGWDNQLVEDYVELKNGAETRLYGPNDNRFPNRVADV